MFGSSKRLVAVAIYDPGADKSIPVMRMADKSTIEAAYACADTTLAAGTVNYYSIHLMDGGTAGTGTTSISGTVGGTAGWTANTPKTIAITDGVGDLDAGDWLVAKYDETGTVPTHITTLVVEYVVGIGEKAAA